MLDLTRFKVLTFDCYGTLIDWETGILCALRPLLVSRHKAFSDSALLEICREIHAESKQGEFRAYREVLQSVVQGLGRRLGFQPSQREVCSLSESLQTWSAFPDTVEALVKLKTPHTLAVISNVDDDLFARSQPKLGVELDFIITAQQARAYKPSFQIFELAEERIGVRRSQWLHVGQSLCHDIVPAKALGIATAWVNRRSRRSGAGAAKAALVQPDLEVPDLKTLAELAVPTAA